MAIKGDDRVEQTAVVSHVRERMLTTFDKSEKLSTEMKGESMGGGRRERLYNYPIVTWEIQDDRLCHIHFSSNNLSISISHQIGATFGTKLYAYTFAKFLFFFWVFHSTGIQVKLQDQLLILYNNNKDHNLPYIDRIK